ncbi:MAG: ribosome small subunit-dependent GTPase A [Gammaproteobacteria bacterium]|nr:ribosome small subunit-dependent GTPase A [Gammaproteobacteria bacterium]
MTHRVGRVVMSSGNHCVIDAGEPALIPAKLARHLKPRPVAGDQVNWLRHGPGAFVESVVPRRNVIERGDFRGNPRALAANIEYLVIVLAPLPAPDTLLLDRFLVLASAAAITPLIWINKTDIDDAKNPLTTGVLSRRYTELGIPWQTGSSLLSKGIDTLEATLGTGTAILVGQSGVGKSSLTQKLVPDLALRIGAVSEASGQGRHTTTETTLFNTPNGGALIDSPGVRTLRLAHLTPTQITSGFPEIADRIGHCRFRDCRHLSEPDCAIQKAVQAGEIAHERLNNWRRLVDDAG